MSRHFKDEFDPIHSEDAEQEFLSLPETKRTQLQYDSLDNTKTYERDLASFPPEQKEKALQRYKLLCLVHKDLKGGWTPKNLNPLIDQHIDKTWLPKPSYKTLIRWHQAFSGSHGSFTSLVDKNYLKGNREPRVTGDEVYYERALERFLDAVRPSINAAYQVYCDEIIIANETIISGKIPTVSYQSFKNRIKKEQPYSVALARHGKYYADKLYHYYQSVQMPTRILERVEIDHTPLDLILLHDDLLIPLGRAYLTLLVDVFSGCIIGFHLGFKAPSYVSASKAILHSIKKKDYISSLPIEFQNEWPCSGKIENLVVDNGAEFWSKSLEDACTESGINIVFNKVRKPWLKPFVERKFGEIIQGMVGWVPGKTFSNVLEKEDYKPEKDAVMRFSVFVEELHRWIVDVHNAKPDTRNTRIPNLYWQKSFEALPPMQLLAEKEKSFSVIMGILHIGALTSKGIKYKHLEYDSVALEQYRKQYPQTKESRKKKIKIDPDDLSTIYVYLEELSGYIEVPSKNSDGYTDNLSLCEHQRLMKTHRDYIKGEINALSLAKARMALHARIKSEQANLREMSLPERTRKASGTKKTAELTGVNSDSSSNKSNISTLGIYEDVSNVNKVEPIDDFRARWNRRKKERNS
ncbi:Mu transposase C-terminal domain-containing protein [Vibrio breoganii]